MSKLADYYADQIRQALRSGEAHVLKKEELMERMNIYSPALMDAVLKEAGRKAKLRCSGGLYYIQDQRKDYKDQYKDRKDRKHDAEQDPEEKSEEKTEEIPKEVREHLKSRMIKGIEVRAE